MHAPTSIVGLVKRPLLFLLPLNDFFFCSLWLQLLGLKVASIHIIPWFNSFIFPSLVGYGSLIMYVYDVCNFSILPSLVIFLCMCYTVICHCLHPSLPTVSWVQNHSCSCSLMFPNDPLYQSFCLIASVGQINALTSAPKQSKSTAIAEVHVITAMVEFHVPAQLLIVVSRDDMTISVM